MKQLSVILISFALVWALPMPALSDEKYFEEENVQLENQRADSADSEIYEAGRSAENEDLISLSDYKTKESAEAGIPSTQFSGNEIIESIWFVGGLFCCILILFMLLFITDRKLAKVKRVVSKLAEYPNTIEKNHNRLHYADSFSTQKEGNNLAVRLSRVEAELTKLTERLNNSEKPHPEPNLFQPEEMIAPGQEAVSSIPYQEEHDIIFYMPRPNSDGSFNIQQQSFSFSPVSTYYKFTAAPEASSAGFEFCSEKMGLTYSLNAPHTYIDPVCDALNALNQNAARITTVEQGIAQKKGDKWVVIKKAKIRYE